MIDFIESLVDKKIPYILGGESITGMDCQGLIEFVLREHGHKVSWRGSNDMFRNSCSKILPLKGNKPVPGCVLFIVSHDGNEPDQYKKDGQGNAYHVGWFTGKRFEVVHASSSKGAVVPSKLINGWTHIGYLKNLSYEVGKMKRGDKGEGVKALQNVLINLDYDLGKWGADGDFGVMTELAVKAFQEDNELPVTGEWGEEDEKAAKEIAEIIDDFPPEEIDIFSLTEELIGISEELIGISERLKVIAIAIRG